MLSPRIKIKDTIYKYVVHSSLRRRNLNPQPLGWGASHVTWSRLEALWFKNQTGQHEGPVGFKSLKVLHKCLQSLKLYGVHKYIFFQYLIS